MFLICLCNIYFCASSRRRRFEATAVARTIVSHTETMYAGCCMQFLRYNYADASVVVFRKYKAQLVVQSHTVSNFDAHVRVALREDAVGGEEAAIAACRACRAAVN
eukprot:4229522-Pleurochrysis_carterae.AAC.1